MKKGVGVFVSVKVPDDKKDEFLKVMAVDVVESRKEEGCISFDLCDQGDGVYSFYEVYKDAEAAAYHKTLPHYMGWAECAARHPCTPPSQPSDRRAVCCTYRFKKANMATVGASQTVVKFSTVEY